jgi:hypothetical protein
LLPLIEKGKLEALLLLTHLLLLLLLLLHLLPLKALFCCCCYRITHLVIAVVKAAVGPGMSCVC